MYIKSMTNAFTKQGGVMRHGKPSKFNPLKFAGRRASDPLGLRLASRQGEQREPEANRGGAVGHPLGKIYQTQALAHASQFIEWCNRLSNPREREQASQIYTWAFWTHKGIFSAPEPSYAGLMICWLIERGCPKLTLSMVKYAFHISTMGDDHETEQ
jgi:hypothetical protein